MNNQNHQQCRGNNPKHKGYGPTSFWLQTPELVFNHLDMHECTVFVDAGCGAGEYSLYAARMLREKGLVIAFDTIESSIDQLNTIAEKEGVTNITGHICDITAALPLRRQSVDVLMLSTVLHIKSVRDRAENMFSEFRRVLRPDGILAVLECKKEEANFGPPLHSRLSADDVEALAGPCGFKRHSYLSLEHTYLACFQPR